MLQRLCCSAICLLLTGALPARAQQTAAARQPFEVYERGIPELQSALASGRVTSVELVDAYLARIAAYDQSGPRLNAIIRLNPQARADAARLDAERRAGNVRGPLHGIPIILKDNYDTKDLATAASSIALAGLVPSEDAFQVRKLRDAGAIILAKSNMHELAAGITTISSLGGQTRNPYDPTRTPGGSSGGSGAALAASFAALAYGSDTCGSIRIPSAFQNLFGLRPTKGLSSVAGIVPLSHSQDVAGPLARSVTDLAIGLDATIGADPRDPATTLLAGRAAPRFVAGLDTTALRGMRLGVLTAHFGDQPEDQEVTRVIRAALDRMKEQGAEVVDITIPQLDSLAGRAGVIAHEFKFDLMDYLAAHPNAPVKSLSEILERGLYHIALEGTFRTRDAVQTRDTEAYRTALARRDSTRALIIGAMDQNRLDAIVYPTVRRKPAVIGETQRGGNCQVSAVTGLPALSAPAGFTADGLPVGIELLGRAMDDAKLVAFAYDYEQATKPRRAPASTPPLRRLGDDRPMTLVLKESATSGLRVTGTLTYDPAARTLAYDVLTTGVSPDRVSAITVNRAEPADRGATVRALSGPGAWRVKGVLELSESERDQLQSGRLVLTVYTLDQPGGAVRKTLRFAR